MARIILTAGLIDTAPTTTTGQTPKAVESIHSGDEDEFKPDADETSSTDTEAEMEEDQPDTVLQARRKGDSKKEKAGVARRNKVKATRDAIVNSEPKNPNPAKRKASPER